MCAQQLFEAVHGENFASVNVSVDTDRGAADIRDDPRVRAGKQPESIRTVSRATRAACKIDCTVKSVNKQRKFKNMKSETLQLCVFCVKMKKALTYRPSQFIMIFVFSAVWREAYGEVSKWS